MKKIKILLSIAVLLCLNNSSRGQDAALNASWTVVGAGPSGILALGIILDSGVPADKVVWLDPEFRVGRMGKYYKNVPGNGRVGQYITILNMCKIFGEVKSAAIDQLYKMPVEFAPDLKFIVDPFADITAYLRAKVVTMQDTMMALDFHDNQWHIQTNKTHVASDNVILATGAHPRTMKYEGITQIPLDDALDKATLATYLNPDDVVAVIGSWHSAILILKYLSELNVTRIINFYKKPIVYPVPMKGDIAFKEAGLKGSVATWAKTVLEKNPPKNIERVLNTPESLEALLPSCTKVIYAAGFERNELPPVNGDESAYDHYDRSSGIIGHRLYGVGIAFPQEKTDPLGNVEPLVGLPYLTFDALFEAVK
jgi:hypothetical protein